MEVKLALGSDKLGSNGYLYALVGVHLTSSVLGISCILAVETERLMITTDLIIDMLQHWLNTPAYSVFGTSYGCDTSQLLLTPLSAPVADEFIAKLKRDIPVLSQLSSDQLSIVAEQEGFEVRRIAIQLGNVLLDVGAPKNTLSTASEVSNAFAF